MAKQSKTVRVERPKLEDLSLKQLQEKAVELGMPKEDVANFNTKSQVILTINFIETLKAKEKVATLEQKEDPKQEKTDRLKWQGKAELMRAKLMKQPKVKILVPLEGKEKKGVVDWVYNSKTKRKEQVYRSGAVLPVQLNGFKYFVPKGVYTEVPEQISRVIESSYNQTSEAGRDFLIDRQDPQMGGSVRDRLE